MTDLHLDTALTLVFVHGVLDDGAVWRSVISALAVPILRPSLWIWPE